MTQKVWHIKQYQETFSSFFKKTKVQLSLRKPISFLRKRKPEEFFFFLKKRQTWERLGVSGKSRGRNVPRTISTLWRHPQWWTVTIIQQSVCLLGHGSHLTLLGWLKAPVWMRASHVHEWLHLHASLCPFSMVNTAPFSLTPKKKIHKKENTVDWPFEYIYIYIYIYACYTTMCKKLKLRFCLAWPLQIENS